jgi:hypothetical protein
MPTDTDLKVCSSQEQRSGVQMSAALRAPSAHLGAVGDPDAAAAAGQPAASDASRAATLIASGAASEAPSGMCAGDVTAVAGLSGSPDDAGRSQQPADSDDELGEAELPTTLAQVPDPLRARPAQGQDLHARQPHGRVTCAMAGRSPDDSPATDATTSRSPSATGMAAATTVRVRGGAVFRW